jgi:hypothetical protein
MRDDSRNYFIIEYTNEDPTKKNPDEWMEQETDEEWEDLPDENDEIEDISSYQNKKDRMLFHFM